MAGLVREVAVMVTGVLAVTMFGYFLVLAWKASWPEDR